MKTQKLISGLLLTILFCFSFGLVNALSFSIKLKSINKAPAQLKYVFVNEVDSTNKDILKLYDDFTYEFLFFQKTKNKPKIKREKGTYSLKNDKLVLDKETEAEVKEHSYHFLYIENKGLANFQRFNKPKKEPELLYVLNNDAKYWQPIYHDPYFGDITNDKKANKKIIDKKPEYNPIAALPTYTINNINTANTFTNNISLSEDSLKKIKAIFIVGPVEESTKEFIDEQKKNAKYLKDLGVQVFEFYHPNAKWKDIVKASQGANILVYAGHGGVAVFCVTGEIVEGEIIQRDLKLHKNAVVIFNHACESAGSSAVDTKDIGQTEAFRRVGDYAKPFIESDVSLYYANNYSDCLIPFFTSFFDRKTVKEIYNKQATKWNKIEAIKKYSYDPNYEISIASKKGSNEIRILTWHLNGKVSKVEKFKDCKSYEIAFVGKPNFTVVDLFKQ
jgi:hypothetical protein